MSVLLSKCIADMREIASRLRAAEPQALLLERLDNIATMLEIGHLAHTTTSGDVVLIELLKTGALIRVKGYNEAGEVDIGDPPSPRFLIYDLSKEDAEALVLELESTPDA